MMGIVIYRYRPSTYKWMHREIHTLGEQQQGHFHWYQPTTRVLRMFNAFWQFNLRVRKNTAGIYICNLGKTII